MNAETLAAWEMIKNYLYDDDVNVPLAAEHIYTVDRYLAAQATGEWTPVKDGAYETEHIDEEVHVDAGWLFMADKERRLVGMLLPDNLRLCERVVEA